MDLSHLVSIGIMAAKKAPLSAADQDYLNGHGVDGLLSDIVNDLIKEKPADPLKFIQQRLGAAPSASAAASPAEKPQAAATGKAPAAAKAAASKPDAAAASKPDAAAAAKKAPAADAGKKEGKKEKGGKKESAVVASKGPSKGNGMEIKKSEDVPGWYAEIMMKAKLIEQYPVKGCFILRPWAYKMWEEIQGWLNNEIKGLGVDNCYFPMFIPQCYMDKESEHLNDFAPELAMVTKIGDRDIEEPVAIRPTSETAMYAAYSNWVQSHRDLPIKLNQWCSVVRWEVKQTTPFLRTREFLWQEGHTAHANREDATAEVLDVLERYAGVYEQLLAVPVVRGTKTKAETFPGADFTTTVEAYIPATGRAIQGATSHHLGQNFSKMFDISFQDPADPTGKKREFAYQNSWGLTQRTIGVMIMVHGDDTGLILPPKVAAVQVVIVPAGMTKSTPDDVKAKVRQSCEDAFAKLKVAGVRVKLDDSDDVTFGFKCNDWEMKGVPVRMEVGPLDVEKGSFVMAKRNMLGKAGKVFGKVDSMVADVTGLLDLIQREMYEKALLERDSSIATVNEWAKFSPELNKGKMVLVPFCGDKECEEQIKEKSKEEANEGEEAGGLKMGAKSLCMPHEEKYKASVTKCIRPGCTNCSVVTTLFGRSY